MIFHSRPVVADQLLEKNIVIHDHFVANALDTIWYSDMTLSLKLPN